MGCLVLPKWTHPLGSAHCHLNPLVQPTAISGCLRQFRQCKCDHEVLTAQPSLGFFSESVPRPLDALSFSRAVPLRGKLIKKDVFAHGYYFPKTLPECWYYLVYEVAVCAILRCLERNCDLLDLKLPKAEKAKGINLCCWKSCNWAAISWCALSVCKMQHLLNGLSGKAFCNSIMLSL